MSARTPFHFRFAPAQPEITSLAPADYAWILREIDQGYRRHLHLDWQSLPEMLGSDGFAGFALREGGRIRSAMGVTLHESSQHAERIAWLRLIVPGSQTRPASLNPLWDALAANLTATKVDCVMLLGVDSWVESLVERWKFANTNSVVTLIRRGGTSPPPPAPLLRFREATHDDLDAVAILDAQAFDLCWHHNRHILEQAARHAAQFSLLELNDELLGYHLSTWHIDTGHLARLAVRPDHQGEGLGNALVGEMLRFFDERGVSMITVNTQADNLASQRLYLRLGFEFANHSVALWARDLA